MFFIIWSITTSNWPYDNIEDMEPGMFNKEELVEVLRKHAKVKLCGSLNILALVILTNRETGVNLFFELCRKIWHSNQHPTEWTESIYIPLHKKGYKEECEYYRSLRWFLLVKIFSRFCTRGYEITLVTKYQNIQIYFVKAKCTREQILNVGQIIERSRTSQCLFVSLTIEKSSTR